MKSDIKRERKDLYAPTKKAFSIVDVPPMQFLMADGCGNPNSSQDYKDIIEALYTVSYGVKFASKKITDKDYVVRPLEGLWWAEDWNDFSNGVKDRWQWTMMIGQPDWIDESQILETIAVQRKKKILPAIDSLRFETLYEGQCVQILHVGPYDDEGPTLQKLHKEFLPQHGLEATGKHHEIYLSDARKTPPDKLKTILRQPVQYAVAKQ